MYGIQSMNPSVENYRHAERQENTTHDEKNQPIKTNQEPPEIVELGKASKTVIITLFEMFKKLSRDMKDILKKT